MSTILQQVPAGLMAVGRAVVRALTDSSTPLLPFIPKSSRSPFRSRKEIRGSRIEAATRRPDTPLTHLVKVLLFLILLVNSSSWPFMWHIRVWYYPLRAYYYVYMKGRKKYLLDWKKEVERAGGVRNVTVRTKRIATADDCDYNMHLSNSCYAKNGDAARMDLAIQAFSPIFTPGTYMAMGASHYVFFKEIPIGTQYVMEAKLGGWGEKWIYVVTEFVIYPKKNKWKTVSPKPSATPSPPSEPVIPSITSAPSRTETPEPSSSTNGTVAKEGSSDMLKRATYRARQPRADGGVVCSLAVNEYCFKIGRVTVPPRVGLWFSMHSKKQEDQDRVVEMLLTSKDRGKGWLRGGWKDEPNAEVLGRDIGLEDGEREGAGEVWYERGRMAMEKVVEGLSEF